ncbi:MAG: hypothetical protein ACTSU5_21160 [Promethearchaeota archaeon]
MVVAAFQEDYFTIPDLVKAVRENPVFFQFFTFFILEWMVFGFMVVLGFSFLVKGTLERENRAQKAYQKGLGYFFLVGALIQVLYLAELMNRFFVGWRIWNNFHDYEFDTIMLYDYFIIYWVALFLSGAFLMYPVEKYLLKRRANFSILALVMSPIPILVRAAEYSLGSKIKVGNVWHLFFTIVWLFIDAIIVIILVVVPVLYLRMWKAAPPKSKLKRKCIEVVVGYSAYIVALVLMRFTFVAIPDPPPLGYSGIVLDAWFYVLIAPIMHFTSLYLISSGFRRDY